MAARDPSLFQTHFVSIRGRRFATVESMDPDLCSVHLLAAVVHPVSVSSPVGGLNPIPAIGTVQLPQVCSCIPEYCAVMSRVERAILPTVDQPVLCWEDSCERLVAFLESLAIT